MKAKENISSLFGFSQEVMAMLLRVTRSRWSLYELGLRSLPLAALERLCEMLLVKNAGDAIVVELPTTEEKAQHQKAIKKALAKNGFQQELLSKKIANFEKKQNNNLTILRFTRQMLLSKENIKATYDWELIKVLGNMASENLQKNGGSQLLQLQIKIKGLKEEERLLREELVNSEEG